MDAVKSCKSKPSLSFLRGLVTDTLKSEETPKKQPYSIPHSTGEISCDGYSSCASEVLLGVLFLS